jgi:Reverse transcriptase (RNA-dependent DNA polymerase)
MKRGIKLFGENGVKAVTDELKQLHEREVMKVKHSKDLTKEQRRDALAYLMYLKRKRCGKYKARGCADGRKQRAWTNKEDASSPTISTEAVFLTSVIDALENRDVAIVDVPGAFMQADMDELVHVRFTGTMVDLLIKIDAEMYEPYVTYEGKEKVMYVELLKALYGTMRAARLFWEKLRAKLLEEGYVPNPYDYCVVNKMINGKQCTIGWHVDDLKISHVDSKVVDQVIDMLDIEYGKETPMNKSRGKVHDYLGMILDFSKPGELTVDMVDYIKTIIAGMPKDMEGTSKIPAGSYLFKVSDNPVLLDKETAEIYHRMVMQLLYLCQRGRPDVRTAVAFLTRRSTAPDRDDYKKLTRVMQYLQGTLDLKLTLSADGSGVVQWWVDAAYGVHYDMKSHTGGTLSMGKGSIYSYSSTQKLVSRSSTEAELIGVDDLMPQMMWTGYFLKAQGVAVVDTVLYQDNKSSMLLEKNGRASSGKRTRHIDIRFYFVADRVANGDLRIEHCPTEEMVADYFTKPLQGALFYRLRDHIMNIDSSSPYHSSCFSPRSVLMDPDFKLNPENANPDIAENVVESAVSAMPEVSMASYRDVTVGARKGNVRA